MERRGGEDFENAVGNIPGTLFTKTEKLGIRGFIKKEKK
jgi:hypothetical protein